MCVNERIRAMHRGDAVQRCFVSAAPSRAVGSGRSYESSRVLPTQVEKFPRKTGKWPASTG